MALSSKKDIEGLIKTFENEISDNRINANSISDRLDKYNPIKEENNNRLEVTKLFLKWFFALIIFAFIFSGLYNFIASELNIHLTGKNQIPFLDVTNTVS